MECFWFYYLNFLRSLLGSVSFYTCLPIPSTWTLDFTGVARWAVLVGLFIAGLLSLVDVLLQQIGLPVFTRSVLIIVIWLGITGGLHLDGVMDTADGLAVQDQERRLAVMADSATGAFGAMAAIAVLLLKTAALSDLHQYRWLGLIAAAGWGRWGQLAAIAFYPYLKPTGKGAFHKENMRFPQDILLGLILLLGLSGLLGFFLPTDWLLIIVTTLIGSAIALLTGAWFNHQLGGHTGDTYGAVVEWTEAFLLCLFTALI